MTELDRLQSHFDSSDPSTLGRQTQEFESSTHEALLRINSSPDYLVMRLEGSNLASGDDCTLSPREGQSLSISNKILTVRKPGWYQVNVLARYIGSSANADLFSALRLYAHGIKDPLMTTATRRFSTSAANIVNQGSMIVPIRANAQLSVQVDIADGTLTMTDSSTWANQFSLHWVGPL